MYKAWKPTSSASLVEMPSKTPGATSSSPFRKRLFRLGLAAMAVFEPKTRQNSPPEPSRYHGIHKDFVGFNQDLSSI